MILATRTPSIVLGSHGWWDLKTLRLTGHDISTHKHVIGLTGQGKSKLLASVFAQLVEQGIGAALIDPHSDLAEDALGLLSHRVGRGVRYVDFARADRYLPFNVLRQPYDDHKIARDLVDVCRRVWPALADGMAPMFENVFLAGCLTLIQSRLPITHLPRLITDKPFRDQLLLNVSDPQVVHFFKATFDRLAVKDQLDQAQSSLRRIFLLTFSPTLRYSLGQEGNALDFRRLMDEGVSVIYDLGGLDEETQKFLGSLLMVGHEVAAKSRSDMSPHLRKPYHLILDEFVRFSAQSEETLANILSETRKYGLFLTMAHQTWSQVSERLSGALQNTDTIAFKLGRSDAKWMAERLTRFQPMEVKHEVEDEHAHERTHPIFYNIPEQFEQMTGELENLHPREAFARIGGKVTKFKTATVKPPTISPGELAHLKEREAESLMVPRDQVVPIVDQMPEVEERRPPPRFS